MIENKCKAVQKADRSSNIGRQKKGELDPSIKEDEEQGKKANASLLTIPIHKTGGLDKMIREEGYLKCDPVKDMIAPSLFFYSIPKSKHMTCNMQDDPEHQALKTQIDCLSETEYLSETNPTSELNRKCNEEQQILKNKERAEQFSSVKNKINESNESHFSEVKKQTILFLKEDQIKPLTNTHR